MMTLLLEVKTSTRNDWYNPVSDGYRAYPRTENGIKKAISNFVQTINKADSIYITDARIVSYSGRFEYWKKDNPIAIHTIDTKCPCGYHAEIFKREAQTR